MRKYLLETKVEAEAATDRLRKCFAEMGYIEGRDGQFIVERVLGRWAILWYPTNEDEPSKQVRWRARETAQIGGPLCFRHFGHPAVDDCTAAAWFMKDCGA